MTRKNNFMQKDFLQSDEWMKFQEAVGRKTFCISGDDFRANIIEHKLPLAGKYFYIPRGPILNFQFSIFNEFSRFNDQISKKIQELINLARENNAGWIRFDAASENILEIIKKSAGADLVSAQISKAPHDMQPREIFAIDISKSEEELLSEMKPKTRYNIKLAEKKKVIIKKQEASGEYIEEFLRLVKITSQRNKITAHPEDYYRKMLENISPDILKLYVAEYDGPASTRGDASSTRGGKIIAANIMVFYGDTCTYLHGASAAADKYKNLMAPYLLQWQAIKDAKKAGCTRYDFGGVKTKIFNFQFSIFNQFSNSNDQISKKIQNTDKWQGITKFKLGFSPKTKPVEFLGSYDIILNLYKYNLYRIIQKIKSFL